VSKSPKDKGDGNMKNKPKKATPEIKNCYNCGDKKCKAPINYKDNKKFLEAGCPGWSKSAPAPQTAPHDKCKHMNLKSYGDGIYICKDCDCRLKTVSDHRTLMGYRFEKVK
jgi:hypothetical protein